MWRLQSWRGSVVSLALAGVLAGGVGARLVAQDTWQRLYLDGETAFKNHDYKTAESKLLAALAAPGVTKSRGKNALVISQQRGFFPEYYLAIICFETNRLADGLVYAGKAEVYLDAKDQIDKLNTEKAAATKALAASAPPPQPQASGDASGTKTTPPQPDNSKPPVDPWASAAANIQSALSANKLSDAISLRDQARRSGAHGDAFNAATHAVDQRDFESSMATATQELSLGHYAAARQAADHAGQLGVDFQKVTFLESQISKLEQQASAGAALTSARGGKPPVTTPAPSGTSAPPSVAPPAPNPVVLDAERRGLTALLLGNYQAAMGALQSAALDPSAPRARFYLACAEAGLSLLESDAAKRSNLETDARRDWQAVAGGRSAVLADLPYISPAILHALGISN
jgi:hypothetical protein